MELALDSCTTIQSIQHWTHLGPVGSAAWFKTSEKQQFVHRFLDMEYVLYVQHVKLCLTETTK